MTARTFEHLKTWDEIVQTAANLRGDGDTAKWALGDLCLYACPEPKNGRPGAGAEERTISALATAIDEHRAVLSGYRANAEFWAAPERAKIPPQVSWHTASEARRMSGWKPGMPVSMAYIDRAMRIIEENADGPIRPRDVATLPLLLDAEMARLSRLAERPDASPVRWLITEAFESLRQAGEALARGKERV